MAPAAFQFHRKRAGMQSGAFAVRVWKNMGGFNAPRAWGIERVQHIGLERLLSLDVRDGPASKPCRKILPLLKGHDVAPLQWQWGGSCRLLCDHYGICYRRRGVQIWRWRVRMIVQTIDELVHLSKDVSIRKDVSLRILIFKVFRSESV